MSTVVETVYMEHRNAVVFAENYLEDLASEILSQYLECEICTIISLPDTVSFYARLNGVDVSALARVLGGDGRCDFAQAKVNEHTLETLIHDVI